MSKKHSFYDEYFSRDVLDQDFNSRFIALYNMAKLQAMFKYNGCPETINPTALERLLQCEGFGVGIIHEGKPYIVRGSLGGELNQNLFPTKAIVANAYLGISNTYTIGKDCIILRSDSMLLGTWNIVRKWAILQARSELTLKMKDTMSRTPFIITANSEIGRAAAECFISKLEDGKMSVIHDNKVLNIDDIHVIPANNTSRDITQAIEYNQYIKGQFANEIGLNANYNMKREYVSNGETGLNEDMLRPFIDDMFECRKTDFAAFNAMAETNIAVSLNSSWKQTAEDETIETEVKDND